MSQSKPASEIIRIAESSLARARDLRIAAQKILDDADALEKDAQSVVLESMGHEKGLLAFEMAQWSLSLEQNSGVQTVKSDVVDEKAPARPVKSAVEVGVVIAERSGGEVSPANVRERKSVQDVNAKAKIEKSTKIVLHGVEIPSARASEAGEIVDQAGAYVAQGRKGNPFGSDRGKNAWRKTLFNAAYVDLATVAHRSEITKSEPEVFINTSSNDDESHFDQLTREYESDQLNQPAEPITIEDLKDVLDDMTMDIINDDPSEDDKEFDGFEEFNELSKLEQIEDFDQQDHAVTSGAMDEQSENDYLNKDSDPFDDMDYLPPVNELPPPRGLAALPEAVKQSQNSETININKGGGHFSRPDASMLEGPETVGGRPMTHTPFVTPASRRAGNGQALQQPSTLPAAIASMTTKNGAVGFSRPTPVAPPQFLTKKV